MKKLLIIVLTLLCMLFAVSCGGQGSEDWWLQQDLPEPITKVNGDMSKADENSPKLQGSIPVISVIDTVKDGSKNVASDIQAALSAASGSYLGGIVYLPRGRYRIDSSINVPSNVTLMGEWEELTASTKKEDLTVIEVYGGMGGAYSMTSEYNPAGAPGAINLGENGGVMNLTFYYPEQGKGGLKVYQPTISNNGTYMMSFAENITIINGFSGIEVNGHNGSYYRNIFMSVLANGMYMNGIREIPVMENITVKPDYWALYDDSFTLAQLKTQFKIGVTGFTLGLIDWIYAYGLTVDSCEFGIKIINGSHGGHTFSTNGQFDKLNITNATTGIYGNGLNSIGTTFSRSNVKATGAGSAAVKFGPLFTSSGAGRGDNTMYFNDCIFESGGAVFENINDTASLGTVYFTNCEFNAWAEESPAKYALETTNGYMVLNSNSFSAKKGQHIKTSTDNFKFLQMYANSFASAMSISTDSGSGKYSDAAKDGKVTVDVLSDELPDVGVAAVRAPQKRNLFYAKDFGAVSYSEYASFNGEGKYTLTDSSEAVQHALNAAQAKGGGYVYLGGGYYRIDKPLVIPEGVELRGTTTSAKHFGATNRGTVLVTTSYGKNMAEAQALITVGKSAGITGLTVYYADQIPPAEGQTADEYNEYLKFCATVSMPKDDAYMYSVTIVNAYNAIEVTGKNVHLSKLRGHALDTFISLNGADNARIDYLLGTGGDWQDCYGLGTGQVPENIPPSTWWQQFPNYPYATALRISGSDDVILYESFVFGFGTGLELVGEVNGLKSYGFGVDASKYGIVLSNSGENNAFTGTQLVCSDYTVHATSGHTGSVKLFLTNTWMNPSDEDLLIEGGDVSLQGYKSTIGRAIVNGGRANLQDFLLTQKLEDGDYHLSIGSAAEKVTALNFLGEGAAREIRINNQGGSNATLINIKTKQN